MKLIINIFFLIFILNSCTLDKTKLVKDKDRSDADNNKHEAKILIEKKQNKIENIKDKEKEKNQLINNLPFYFIGDSYFIDGVEHIPQQNYKYNENGLATYYGKELHNKRTVNNELNKVTELLGRHKTLPLPSVVKITNLENGLSLIIRINDRSQNNVSIIEVSRKVAQLLRFYKEGIARVRVEILPDSSKQLKIVTESMSNPNFNTTIDSSPTETVLISDLGEADNYSNKFEYDFEQPIELGFEQVSENNLLVKIEGFNTYNEIQNIIGSFENNYKTTIQNKGSSFSAFFGPLDNFEANKLVQFLISKGYKNAEIVIK